MHLNTKWESSNFAFQDQVTSGTTLSSNQSFSSVNSTVSVPNGQSGAYTYQWSPNTSGVILPSSGTYQVGVITGGTPAEYGDLTGGVVSMNVIGNGVKTNQSEPVGLGLTTPSTVTVDGNLVALFSNDGEKAKQKQGWEDPNAVEEYAPIYENSFLAVQQEPLSTFSIDVDRASYANMRRFLNSNQLPAPDVIRIEEMVNYFHYDYKEPKDQHPFNVITEVSTCPWQPDHRLVHIGLQGKKIQTDNLPATNLVFLIDVSGSMDSEDKLGLLKQSFTLLTEQLRKQDRVAMVVYAGAAGVVLPSTPGDQKETILNALNNLTAGGSTAGGAGIELAYKIAKDNFIPGGNNRIVLATDGDFNVGINSESGLEDLIVQKRKGGVFLSVLGFGMGNYKDSKMEILADKGNGNYAYIDGLMEAQKTLVSEFGGTMFAIAKDVKLQIEFNPAQVKGYRLIGYENRALRNEDFANDKIDAGELGEGHTVTALYEIIPAGSKEEIPGFEPLKYQSQQNWGNSSDEMLTVKLRYKKPDGEKSILLAHELVDDKQGIIQSSNNFRWSAAVASFGMVLRGSAHKGQSNCDLVLKLAQSAAGKDAEGYRAEFITLVQKAKLLMELKNVEVRDK
ncbi:MAG: VWA domain-containing protein [Bacteroidia bacterium]|nr:VWA domain-containing protein [Bacteroidia bacterium]